MRRASLSLLALLCAAPALNSALAQTPLAVQSAAISPALPVAAGIATPAERGLSDQLWQEMRFTEWQALLKAQPQRQSSPALRQLLAMAISSRATLPADATGDTTLPRAQALAGYASPDMLGLFIAAQPAGARTPALLNLQQTNQPPRSEAEAQLQADLMRESGKANPRAEQQALADAGDPAAAEWLATYGYGDQLAETYTGSPPFGNPKGAALRAALWQNLQGARTIDARAKLLNSFIASGGAPALLGPRGKLLLPFLADVPVTSATAWAAPNLFALAAAQDERVTADAIYDTVVTLAETLDAAEGWQARLYPVAIAMGLDAANPAALPDWVATARAHQLPLFDILTLLESRGVIVPREIWEEVSETSGSTAAGKTDPDQLALMKRAAGNGKQGEVILRAGILAGTDLSAAPVPVTAAIIRAFAMLGLNEVADRLTVEALLELLYPAHG